MDKVLKNYINDPYNPETNFWFGEQYYQEGHKAAALTLFLRTAEYGVNNDLTYESLLKVGLCLKELGDRPHSTRGAFLNALTFDRERPEAYYHLSYDHQIKGEWQESYLMAVQGLDKLKNAKTTLTSVDFPGEYALIFQKGVAAWWIGYCDESRIIFRELLDNYPMSHEFINACYDNLYKIGGVMYKSLPYTKDNHSKLRYNFKNSVNIEKNYSQVFQDMFVLSMLDGKENGTYVEIGAAEPFNNNNTALLEKDFKWSGISLENNEELVNEFNSKRDNKCLLQDATTADYEEIFVNNNFDKTIDYLQIDVEPAEITFTTLLTIPFDKYKFRVITYEHDYYVNPNTDYRRLSRRFLEAHGYKMVVGDISYDSNSSFEDWWVHPDLVDSKILKKMMDNSEKTKRADFYLLKN
jgi:tetratricopeptide (TPR) repeat protein